MTAHRLDCLLRPKSIAVVGASEREGTVGHGMVEGLIACGFKGPIYTVNPKYETVQGLPCFPSLKEIPEPVDLALLGVNSIRMEQQVSDAIARGVRACTIFDACYLDDEHERGLLNRLKAMTREAGMPVCGGNGMGFLNMADRISATTYNAVGKMKRVGNVAFVTHSGTVFSEIGLNDFRYACNLVVSCGQEINGTMADYIDFALSMPSTRVIALFMETARDPAGMAAALAHAQRRDVPVVVMKVGRTPAAAEFAVTHSDALVGDDAAYAALFDRYGVLRVDSLDEMGNLLTLLAHERQPASGGIGVVLDSGGEREMLVDLAEQAGVPFARISDATQTRLRLRLHHALEAVNPLDAWGSADNYEEDFEEYFVSLADDPDCAIAMFCGDFTWSPTTESGYTKALAKARDRTDKPLAALLNSPMSGLMSAGQPLCEAGIAVLCGTGSALRALDLAFRWRDRAEHGGDDPIPAVDASVIAAWRNRLASAAPLDEAEGLLMLSHFGIPTPRHAIAEDAEALAAAAATLAPPYVLKTAMAGILHKSDVGGVRLGLADEHALLEAYGELEARLGPRVLVSETAAPGTELVFGMVRDAQFGPLVVVGAGGILVEVLNDVRHALAPFGPGHARRLIDGLRVRRLLDSVRGKPAADVEALAEALARFSVLAAELGDLLDGFDVNPVIASSHGVTAVDALAVPATPAAD